MNNTGHSLKEYKDIIFDLDGTLSDPREGIFKGLRHALRQMGIEVTDDHDFSYVIGPPLHDALYLHHFSDRDKVMTAVKLFREYYAEKGLFENEIFEGIRELLEGLRAKGKRLFVATNKPQPFAERILKHFGIYDLFTGIYGVDVTKEHVSKEELVERLMNEHNVSSGDSVLVGDTKYDVMAARAYGIDAIVVGYGFGPHEELREMEPVAFVYSVKELSNLFGIEP
jgi:phosphoglycolate phosphatase